MKNNWKNIISSEEEKEARFALEKDNEISPILLQLLFNRGIRTKEEIKDFLEADFQDGSFDPFLFKDMEKAVDSVIAHIKAGHIIYVYGDYDADGVTASVVLVETLSLLKAEAKIYIPDRSSEGYGLNRSALDEIAADGAKLVITVDNGIRNKDEIEYAKSIGLEVIVTDHHMPPEEKNAFPDTLVINPMASQSEYPFLKLAGVGVSFKLAQAIISRAKLEEEMKKRLYERIMDLVAIGTVADCVSLLGENRVLVKKGIEVMNATKRVGLQELIKGAGLSGELDAWNIAFQLAPRLNAAGRMDHANTAFELLITKDRKEAADLSVRLNESNTDRQRVTEEIIFAIEKNIREEGRNDKIIVAVSPEIFGAESSARGAAVEDVSWNEGVIGLAAGKICEKYYKPTLVLTVSGDEYKCSGRSISEFNIVKAIEKHSRYLTKYGGHALACGFSLEGRDNLENFITAIRDYANSELGDVELKPSIDIDAEVGLEQIGEDFIAEIEHLAPFGQDNPRPKFLSREVTVLDTIRMGMEGKHIKLRIKNDKSSVFSAIGFGQAETWKHIGIGDKIDIVYYAEMNNFNGRSEPQLKIIDIDKI